MTTSDSSVAGRVRWALIALVLAALCASAVIAFARAKWWVVNTDGGWYSYPAYAMSEGRDPGENMLPPEQVSVDTPGVRAVFHWENRSFLLTRFFWAWFRLAGHGPGSLALFGLLQWLACAALVASLIQYASGNRWASMAGAVAILADSKFISGSFSGLRPDVLLAILSLGCLGFLFRYLRLRSDWNLLAGGFLLLMLPLIHTTGALPMAALLAYIGLLALIRRNAINGEGGIRLAAALLIVAAVAVVVFRQSILDALVPTHVPLEVELPGRHNLVAALKGIADRGAVAKMLQEAGRWRDYFLRAELAQLFFLAIGCYGVVSSGVSSAGDRVSRTMLLAGWCVGIITISCLDPHTTESHLIPLVSLGYVVAGIGWARVLDYPRAAARSKAVAAMVAIAAMVFGLKSAQAVRDVRKGLTQDVSGESVRALVERTLPTSAEAWVVGPASVWLYSPANARCVVIDRRDDPAVVNTELWRHVGVLIIDSDFLNYGWASVAQDGVAKGWLRPIGRVGRPNDGAIYYMEAFRVVHTRER